MTGCRLARMMCEAAYAKGKVASGPIGTMQGLAHRSSPLCHRWLVQGFSCIHLSFRSPWLAYAKQILRDIVTLHSPDDCLEQGSVRLSRATAKVTSQFRSTVTLEDLGGMSFSPEEAETLQRAAEILNRYGRLTCGLQTALHPVSLTQTLSSNSTHWETPLSATSYTSSQAYSDGAVQSTLRFGPLPRFNGEHRLHTQNQIPSFSIENSVHFQCDVGFANWNAINEYGNSREIPLEDAFVTPQFTLESTSQEEPFGSASFRRFQSDALSSPEHPQQFVGTTSSTPAALTAIGSNRSFPSSGHSSASQSKPCRTQRTKAKRTPYDEHAKQNTNLTRQNKGCIRCRFNRKRVCPWLKSTKRPLLIFLHSVTQILHTEQVHALIARGAVATWLAFHVFDF